LTLLIVVCGLSFAGKSTLGTAIATRHSYVNVDVDETKARLFGMRFDENSLSQSEWDRIYAGTDLEIAEHLRCGRSVVDASRNFRKQERDNARRIATAHSAKFVLIYVDTPESVARERMLANRKDRRRVDWGDDSFDAVVAAMQPPTIEEDPLVFNFRDDISAWITRHTVELGP
jgi:predicted kinase